MKWILFLFDIYLKFKTPNFKIFSIKKLKRADFGFWLNNTKEISENCIVEYKYNNKRLKYLTTTDKWPPVFSMKGKVINQVLYKGKDLTKEVLSFAGPLKKEFNPISLLMKGYKWRITFFQGSLIKFERCEVLFYEDVDYSLVAAR